MIKLTVSPNENPIVLTFDKTVVTIGSGYGPIKADLSLSDPELQPIHIKIMKDGNRFRAINIANDPFITLNDLPFGKKTIKNNDLLQIGQHIILFELKASSYSAETMKPIQIEQPPDPLVIALEKLIITRTERSVSNLPRTRDDSPTEAFEEEPKPKENRTEGLDLAELIREVEQANAQAVPQVIEEKYSQEEKKDEVTTPVSTPTYKKHLPEYQVGEFDDESENWTEKDGKTAAEMESEVPPRLINWKMIGTIALSAVLVFLLLAGALYFNVSAKNENEELKAAESVADVAMALKYAQIHHIKPHKKNWSDPEFIKKSLTQVIPHDYPSLPKIDPQGHLNDTSYSLRIYTSSDFSQFLVIAQPPPSFLQWLIPKTAIVVDSKLMQFKKVTDMKTLNRLLVNSNNLDNSNAIEVTNLVKRGELIPLSTLAQKRKGQDFSPPKALALLRPGAENYIYNAPRYYQLGETIMKRAIALMETPGSAFEMSRLKQDMSILSKMQDMVLYSPDGIQLTLDAQKAIAAFVSNARFLTAYLKFDPKGMIINSHLIIDDESSSHALHVQEKPLVKRREPQETLAVAEPKTQKVVPAIEKHPLLSQLTSLCTSRESALTPLKNQIIALLNEDAIHPIDGLETRLNDKLLEYFEADLIQKVKLAKALHRLSEEYRLIPLNEFMNYLNQAGLGEGCREILSHVVKTKDQNTRVQSYINDIKTAENFVELEKFLNNATHWLVVKNFADLNQLQIAQRIVKIETISRINKLLLSSMPAPLGFSYDASDRLALQHILNQALETSEEQAYYLNEFDKNEKGEG